MMEIIEHQVIGKKSQETCEDGIVATRNHVAVIDGSTSKTERSVNPAERNGRYAMQVVGQVIAGMPTPATCHEFCQMATAAIQEAYGKFGISPELIARHPEQRLTCSAAVYSDFHKEVWLVGDCQCLVDGTLHDNPKPHEATNAEKRSRYIKAHRLTIEQVQTHDEGRDQITADIIRSTHEQNKTFAVIDGTPVYEQGISIIDVAKAREIVLATDVYPFLKSKLKESESALTQLLASDPLCITLFKATKAMMHGYRSFDDRCYVRFRPNP